MENVLITRKGNTMAKWNIDMEIHWDTNKFKKALLKINREYILWLIKYKIIKLFRLDK